MLYSPNKFWLAEEIYKLNEVIGEGVDEITFSNTRVTDKINVY